MLDRLSPQSTRRVSIRVGIAASAEDRSTHYAAREQRDAGSSSCGRRLGPDSIRGPTDARNAAPSGATRGVAITERRADCRHRCRCLALTDRYEKLILDGCSAIRPSTGRE
jgi:hypothetical protein